MRKYLLTACCCMAMAALKPYQLMAQLQGPSSSQTSYVVPIKTGVSTTAILSTADVVGPYTMCGTPDGLGAFDNGNGTFTLLMNHEFGNTAGLVRAHGSKGSFVSKWIINKSNLSVISGSDLMQQVKLWVGGSYITYNAANPYPTGFNRFCSADLPATSAFYNAATGKGTMERIFMDGEEAGSEGRAFGHVASGANAGTSYELPYLGKFSWENAVANPGTGDKTVVAGMDDATPGQVYFYIGTKTAGGNEIEKAGLANGNLYSPIVSGMALETSGFVPAPNTSFTMAKLGDVHNMNGSTLNSNSNSAGVTQFLRPEDGAWDPGHPEDFYFATTNAFAAPSRLWKLHFSNINDLTVGGTISAVLDGTEGQKMLDNITIDHYGHVLMVEDVGGNAHNGKIWQYTIATDALELIARHDVARFGDINIPATPPFNQDEEASGILDVQEILGAGKFLLVDQAHYPLPGQLVEGGQLMMLYNPDTYTACSSFTGNIAITPTPAVTGQAPATIYLGYGPQQLTLTATAPAANGPYTYTWMPGGSATQSMVISPTSTTTYSVTITNIYGCSTRVFQTIKVMDVRDGDKEKVFICHNGHMQSVSVNAVPAHLAHGDLLGSCSTNTAFVNTKAITTEIRGNLPVVYPNPVKGVARVSFSLNRSASVVISVSDLNGKTVIKPFKKTLPAGRQVVELNTLRLTAGSYIVQVNRADESTRLKLVVIN